MGRTDDPQSTTPQKTAIRKILNSSRHNGWTDPETKNLETRLGIQEQVVEIDEIEFRDSTGKYIIRLTNQGIVEMCSICGEFQAMNTAAMNLYDPALAEELEEEEYQWNNNRCEQKHQPFYQPWNDPKAEWNDGEVLE